jgi:addiction module RelB/DinJ family antitoxin
MDTNITFRIDSEVKAQMAEICAQLGMSQSAAFNMFAKAFVRQKGMPFTLTIQEPAAPKVTKAQMLADTDSVLDAFAEDYKRMAE